MTCRILVSYHFHRKTDLAALVAAFGEPVDLFADSGAFSAYTKGSVINLADYAAWLKDWDRLFTVKSNLDVIGDHEATARNLEKLPGTLPVFHPGAPWEVLERLCKEYDYVALGGVAGKVISQKAAVFKWLVHCFQIAKEYGTVFHGFGITSTVLVKKLPFYSLDSSSWAFGARRCLVYLWDERSLTMTSTWLREHEKLKALVRPMRDCGLDPAKVISHDFLNVPGDRGADRDKLMAASIVSYRKLEAHLQRRHAVTPPPLPQSAEIGTKIYMALSGGDPSKSVGPFVRARQVMP